MFISFLFHVENSDFTTAMSYFLLIQTWPVPQHNLRAAPWRSGSCTWLPGTTRFSPCVCTLASAADPWLEHPALRAQPQPLQAFRICVSSVVSVLAHHSGAHTHTWTDRHTLTHSHNKTIFVRDKVDSSVHVVSVQSHNCWRVNLFLLHLLVYCCFHCCGPLHVSLLNLTLLPFLFLLPACLQPPLSR